MFANHRLYDKKGRRLAIFGRVKDDSTELFILTCSKHDTFNKKLATEIYNLYLNGKPLEKVLYGYTYPERTPFIKETLTFKPLIYTIPITQAEHSKNEFLRYCAENFCSAYPEYGIKKVHYYTDSEADALLTHIMENA